MVVNVGVGPVASTREVRPRRKEPIRPPRPGDRETVPVNGPPVLTPTVVSQVVVEDGLSVLVAGYGPTPGGVVQPVHLLWGLPVLLVVPTHPSERRPVERVVLYTTRGLVGHPLFVDVVVDRST